MLLPFLFLTGIWGPEGTRVAAITKLFIYTLVGSLLMLAAAIATGVLVSQNSGNDLSFAFSDLAKVPLAKGSQEWIFLCFAAAFWVKMPAFPVHGWMPDGYRNMPLPVLAVFSAVLSKVAAYGFLRVVIPLFPDASRALPGPDAGVGAGLDPLRLGDGVHDVGDPVGVGVLVDRPAGLHHAGDLRAQRRRRPGRDPAGRQPRPRRRPRVRDRRLPRRAHRRLARTSATWAGSRSARPCSPRCS